MSMQYTADSPPPTVAAAQERRRRCIAEAIALEGQLGSSRRGAPAAVPVVDTPAGLSYAHAKAVWHARKAEAAYLRRWLAEQNAPRRPPGQGRRPPDVHAILKAHQQAEGAGIGADALSVLRALYAICVRMMQSGVSLTTSERLAVSAACQVLRAHGMYLPQEETQ